MLQEGLRNLADDESLLLTLPDGRLLPVPAARLRGILNVLIELYDQPTLDSDGNLRLPRLQAVRLAELEAVLYGEPLRWHGGEALRTLAERLRTTSLNEVPPPPGLRTDLRHYQQRGLAWLQYLRECELGGILADDMGLGKTVQALAHLLVEKTAGRLDRPSLVVAPTSLMANWRDEAARFAPDLRVLTLQGPDRRERFAAIPEHDLVLTTYALLPRDCDTLLAHEYHLLILDEAQAIKNPKAQAGLVARSLKTRHRLCLTGTPMENHLGELWSLFDLLLPGLLGDEREFRRLFRRPIEQFGDNDRRNLLVRRIAPFMLRRTKEQVAPELPPKTEIVRTTELHGSQRDLYESIRVAMQDKVREAVQRQGLARSQIIILDALLRLRQVCCDPRLLKLAAAKPFKSRQSAKLDLLLELMTGLLAEQRHILLFSQFTSMLALIEAELERLGIAYVKLTGSTQDRATPVARFQSGTVPLFLISLKAGGTGLNLTAADTVIHYDPWWNPAVEDQATDRAYRIGQDKPVFVYKLFTEGTVEVKIRELQARKRALLNGVLASEGAEQTRWTEQDLEFLFAPLH
jgi:SNF2 family DNA or RNA helicase